LVLICFPSLLPEFSHADSLDGGLVAFKFETRPELAKLKFEIVVEESIELTDRILRAWSRHDALAFFFFCFFFFLLFCIEKWISELTIRYFVQNSTVMFSLLNEHDYSICILGEQEFLTLSEADCMSTRFNFSFA
jgi:hypothetical protein